MVLDLHERTSFHFSSHQEKLSPQSRQRFALQNQTRKHPVIIPQGYQKYYTRVLPHVQGQINWFYFVLYSVLLMENKKLGP